MIRIILFILLMLAPVRAESKELHLTIQGLLCNLCEKGLVDGFKSEGAVDKVEVNLSKNYVKLQIKPSASLSHDKIKNIIENSGFILQSVKEN